MNVSPLLPDLSAVAAGVYGTWLINRPPSVSRAAVKVSAVGLLVVTAYVAGAPLPLIAALAASAVGDAFFAGEPARWLAAGVAAFLLAWVGYLWLFIDEGFGAAILEAEPIRAAGAGAALLAGLVMLAWLWRSLGALRLAMAASIVALSLMTATAFTLPHRLWPVIGAAVALMVSDAIWSARIFKGLPGPWAIYAAWWSYYAAQYAVVWAYLR